jgi:acetate CoA/acetoacetate CoA-transferase alpha subunit
MNKLSTVDQAIAKIDDGMTLMIAGFLGCGTPETLIDAIVEKGTKDLTIICNDTAFPDKGIGKLIVSKQVKKVITSHIGTNPETGRQMNEGEIEVILSPQGTIAEQVRAAGAGLGAVVTPTGVGTVVEEGKQTIEIKGKKYLIEEPLRADVAIINAHQADKKGNLVYNMSAVNFNPLMATAADTVIVEAEEIVEVGDLNPNFIHTPHIFVDMIVKGGQNG